MPDIEWFTNDSVESAVTLARETARPLLVDFWSPTCRGCAKLFVTTYPDFRMQQLGPHFIWIKYNTKAPNAWFKRLNGAYGHHWHPDLLVLDPHLIELRRVIGYLPPEELVPQLELGRALGRTYHRAHDEAVAILEAIVTTYPQSAAAPEALYWAGVAAARAGGEADLRRYWGRIGEEYPFSDWRLRADCLDVVIPKMGFSPEDPSSVTWQTAEGWTARRSSR